MTSLVVWMKHGPRVPDNLARLATAQRVTAAGAVALRAWQFVYAPWQSHAAANCAVIALMSAAEAPAIVVVVGVAVTLITNSSKLIAICWTAAAD